MTVAMLCDGKKWPVRQTNVWMAALNVRNTRSACTSTTTMHTLGTWDAIEGVVWLIRAGFYPRGARAQMIGMPRARKTGDLHGKFSRMDVV